MPAVSGILYQSRFNMTNNKDKNRWIDDLNNETRSFAPVGGENRSTDGETRAFSVEEGFNEPLERCEERGSLKELPTGAFIWRIGKPLLILAISAALVLLLGVSVYHYIEESYVAPVADNTSQTVYIEIGSGASLSKISTLLYEKGIIRNKFAFQLYADFNDVGGSLKAGKYNLSPGMTLEQIADVLLEGNPPRTVTEVLFLEGYTVVDMAAKLEEKDMFDAAEKAEFLKLCDDADAFSAEYDFIAALSGDENLSKRVFELEGYLSPNTYEFYTDSTPKEVIKKLLDQFNSTFVDEYKQRAAKLNMTVDQVVTLASIIEWEATEKNFKNVSAVFHNRLKDNWAFGSCASLRYVTGIKKQTYTAEEQSIDSPYNTYMYKGLPVGPINNPGAKAIGAALYPNQEYIDLGYYYFVNVDKASSELAFAKTEKEHQKNVDAYNASPEPTTAPSATPAND